MSYGEQLWSIIRCWDDGLLWRFEWERDIDTWAFLPMPPWSAEA